MSGWTIFFTLILPVNLAAVAHYLTAQWNRYGQVDLLDLAGALFLAAFGVLVLFSVALLKVLELAVGHRNFVIFKRKP